MSIYSASSASIISNSGTARKCGACGEVGHIRTNSKCPEFFKSQQVKVATQQLYRAMSEQATVCKLCVRMEQLLTEKTEEAEVCVLSMQESCNALTAELEEEQQKVVKLMARMERAKATVERVRNESQVVQQEYQTLRIHRREEVQKLTDEATMLKQVIAALCVLLFVLTLMVTVTPATSYLSIGTK